MAQEEQAPVRAPQFPSGVTWVQGGPITRAQLKGRAVSKRTRSGQLSLAGVRHARVSLSAAVSPQAGKDIPGTAFVVEVKEL